MTNQIDKVQVEKQLIELIGNRVISRLSDVCRYVEKADTFFAASVFNSIKEFLCESEMTYHLVFPNLDFFLMALRKGPFEKSLYQYEGDLLSALLANLDEVTQLIQDSLDELG